MAHRPHLYLPRPWTGDVIGVSDETRHHIERVLRATDLAVDYTDGEGVVGSGRYASGELVRGNERQVPLPSPAIGVAVAAPQAADRQRFVVEKLAEVGIERLIWLRTAHGGHRAPPHARAVAWSVAALEQSRGARLMQIEGPVSLSDLADRGPVQLAHPGTAPLRVDADPLVLAIGPEGGFAETELAVAGAGAFGLGARILRIETAAVVAATIALHATGRLARTAGD